MLVNATALFTSSWVVFSDDVDEQADKIDTAAKVHAVFIINFFTLYPYFY
ncbi:hypothetical protein THOG11_70284 [Vibrio harveyi]|nr:hypothetical protein TH15OA1_470048 [Vibrio harveyi]CAH1578890.1 hypothetical protein THOD03_60282 [Vibrio harveyi]CAH1587920.1 hypothetical protein THOG11_70284 [Vibrio harveyi]